MRRVTVRVPLEESLDLLDAPRRACLSFVDGGRPCIEPVVLSYLDGRYLVGLEQQARQPADGSEVVLLVDDGVLFFELRAVYIRGQARRRGRGPDEERIWFEVEPVRVSSWNYGRMRVEDAT